MSWGDVTKTGNTERETQNGKRGTSYGEREMGNGEPKSGKEWTTVTRRHPHARQRREIRGFAIAVKTWLDLVCCFNTLPILALVSKWLHTLSHFAQIVPRHLGQLKRPFVFSLGQNDRSNMYFGEVQMVQASLGPLRVQRPPIPSTIPGLVWSMMETARLQQELKGPSCQTWILLCTQLHTQLKHSASVVKWKIGVFRRKHFVQKQEIVMRTRRGRNHATTKKP